MDKKALIVSADLFEDSELLCPMYRLQELGYQVDIAAPQKGTITGKHGYKVEAGLAIGEVESAGSCGYSVLVLPGGKAPAAVRQIPAALDIVRDFVSSGIPIAAICHGPQVLVSAGVVNNKRMTCYQSVAEELKDAGAQYEDVEVVVDGQFVTSRMPMDIPAFNRELVKKLG